MLIRLVRMRFRSEEVERFLALYDQAYPIIVGQPGCRSVQLVREIDDPAAFATWSVWDDAAALDAYRRSAFFRGFWPEVKALFRAPAQAVSFEEMHHGGTERINGTRQPINADTSRPRSFLTTFCGSSYSVWCAKSPIVRTTATLVGYWC